MPNICENYVLIRGGRETLDIIKAAKLDMIRLVPPPAHLADAKGWNGDRWDWIQENYSTKWICNEEHDGPPVIDDQGVYLISHFDSAWTFPYAFYQNLIRRFPDVAIEYQYHSWESSMIGHGKMDVATVDVEPMHYNYDTPDELNTAIREFEGAWMVGIIPSSGSDTRADASISGTGNPHFDYDSQTGLYKWQTAGGGGCQWVSEAAADANADAC